MRLLKTQKLTQDEECPLCSPVLSLAGLPSPGACATGPEIFTFHSSCSRAQPGGPSGMLVRSMGLGARAVSLEAWL